METYQLPFPGLVKKAKAALTNSEFATNYSSTDRGAFVQLAEGTRQDKNASLPLVPDKQIQALSPPAKHKKCPTPPQKKTTY